MADEIEVIDDNNLKITKTITQQREELVSKEDLLRQRESCVQNIQESNARITEIDQLLTHFPQQE